jgi:hypothetical protein
MPDIDIEAAIEARVGEVRTDSLDFSFGELISLYENNELVIRPDFQRYFRWTTEKESRLIESIVLGVPLPQIFTVETESGVLELIDGLQRISSIIHFIQYELIKSERVDAPLVLEGCDLVPELNGITFADLPVTLRLGLKRSKIRAIVVKRQSSKKLRYEMFKRLNTGGAPLSEQEIRNVSARMLGDDGNQFYDYLMERAKFPGFSTCVATLSEAAKERRADEELVLRFFALKNAADMFKGSVVDWLNDYMDSVLVGGRAFEYGRETQEFDRLFTFLSSVMGESAFVRFRGTTPIGGLAPAHFEAVSLGTWRVLDHVQAVTPERVRNAIIQAVQSDVFKDTVGPGSNALYKFRERPNVIEDALRGLM